MSKKKPVFSKNRACNLCGGKDFDLRFKKNDYSILKCTTCGLIFTDPIPKPDELKSLYGESYFHGEIYNNYEIEISNRVRDYQRWLAWIEEKSSLSSGSWLDIGCATGGFMKFISQRHWDVYGTDISEFCVNKAKAAGLNVAAGTAEEIPLEWGQFAMISMWDTIEHLEDPSTALKAAAGRLQPGGWLVLSTGDISSIAARLMGKNWWLMLPPIHLYYFTKQTLESMLRKVDLIPICGQRFGRRLRIGRAFRLLSGVGSTSAERGPSFYFNAFDIMTILARQKLPNESCTP